MLDQLEASFHTASETPRSSFVKQRCAELELLRPFCEARDLMRASLADPEDRDRSQLASLVGEEDGARMARARSASEVIVKSEVKLPPDVLFEFLAACDSCEKVLNDHVSGDLTSPMTEWVEVMATAA